MCGDPVGRVWWDFVLSGKVQGGDGPARSRLSITINLCISFNSLDCMYPV